MSSTLATATPLTRDDINAWKIATNYTLHLHEGHGGSLLRLYFEATGPAPYVFTPRQQVLFPGTRDFRESTRIRDIFCDAFVTGYGNPGGTGGWSFPSWSGADDQEPVPHCFYSGYDRETRQTITRSLKTGSILKLLWIADNNTETAQKLGLHLDAVKLQATSGTQVDVWNIGATASYDNSARMIRRQR